MNTRVLIATTISGQIMLAFSVALFAALLSCTALVSSSQVDLESLCAGKATDLTRSSQLKTLISELDSSSACPEHVRSALKDLGDLIASIDGRVCSLEAVDEIRGYYEAYLSPNAAEKPLPKALNNFALAYGLQVSKLCKKNMINSLLLDTKALLTDADHKLIAPWTNEQSVLNQLMSDPSDYDDLLLPRDLTSILEETQDKQERADSRMYIQSMTNRVIQKMQAICHRRFKPIYEQLILPLIFLSNMGFNYQGEELERELKEMSLNKEIHQWYRIVYLCEPLEDIEIVEDPRDAELVQGTEQSVVRILTREEAAKVKAELGQQATTADAPELRGIKQLVYKQDYETRLGDEVVDAGDASLMKLVRKFDSHKSELERVRGKLIRKLAKFMINKLKHGHFSVLGSLMGSKSSQQNGREVQSANGEIVSALDEYVAHSTATDGAVTGRFSEKVGVAKRYYHKAATDGAGGMTRNLGRTVMKRNMRWYFWYSVALLLFIVGIVVLVAMG